MYDGKHQWGQWDTVWWPLFNDENLMAYAVSRLTRLCGNDS